MRCFVSTISVYELKIYCIFNDSMSFQYELHLRVTFVTNLCDTYNIYDNITFGKLAIDLLI